MKRMDGATNLILVACALVTAFVVVRRELSSPVPRVNRIVPERVQDWREYAVDGTRMGADSASVVITAFADFQCPYCRQLAGTLADVLQRYPYDVAVSYRHFPLESIHPHARQASLIAECAAAEGRFREVHDAFYEYQRAIAEGGPLQTLAVKAGADTVSLAACARSDSAVVRRIASDVEAGVRLGVAGTPTVLVNDVRVRGTPSFAVLDSIVLSMLPRR